MSENNPSKENEVPTNDNNEKITFEEYINEVITNSKNKEEQVKKKDLLNDIEKRVENGNDSKIKGKIESIFLNEESLTKNEIEEKLNNINEESPKKETLMDLIKFSEKKVTKDLEFLSENLPEDKNREKILTHTNFSLTEINTYKNIEDENKINKESTFNITKIESVIKPVNGFDDIQKDEKDNNEKEKKPKPKEINKPIYNPNEISNKKSSFLLTTNNLKTNIVSPTNENNNINLKENNENLNNNLNNNKNNSDYFLSIYKTYAPNNKMMKTLDEKINKVSTKPIRQNNILSFSKGINTLNDFKINNKPFTNTKKKNYFLDKIEQEQKIIMKSGIKESSLHQYKPKQYDLKKTNEKKAYVENIKNELMEFSKNIDKQKQRREKNSGFDEINQKLDELYKKNKETKILKSEETNNVNEENKVEKEEKKESQ